MSRFAGTAALVRLALRRDRLRIPLWVLGIAGLVYASGSAVAGVYDDRASIDAYANLVGGSPMTVAFAGPPVGLHTLAGIVVYETSFTAVVGVALMAVMTTTRHTRAEEESGRSELLRSTEVGRHAGGLAGLVTCGIACVALGLALWAALASTAMSVAAAGLFAAGMTLLGLVLAAVTLCLAQLFTHARTATGAGVAFFAVGYVVRAAGDVREDWLVWLSPVGWVQATHVPTENRWWPLLVPLAATVLLVWLAVVLAERRDFGGGLLPARPGRPHAPWSLTGTVGLAWRLQRGAVLGWSVGLLLGGALTGGLGSAMQDMVEENPTLAEYLTVTEGASVLDSYLATMVLILALTTGGYAVWAAGHTGVDESDGRLELLLAGPLDRRRWMLGELFVAGAGTVVVLLAAAVGIGVAHGAVTDDAGEGWRAFTAQLAYLPALLVLVGLVAVVRGWRPGWSFVGWVVLAFCFVVGWLGGLLQPPEWVADLSPFSHVPRVPVDRVADPALAGLLLVAVALAAVGVVGFRRRDVGVG
ncbi:MAG TPA: polyketide antibiotic transporter [Marmoricola sp.]|nr:polyketide antibiotic transporter [Marmoricola sp.]